MLRLWLLALFLVLPAFPGEDLEQDQYTNVKGDYAASHILVAHLMALRASKEITRNKPEALAKAEELLARIKEDPSLFEEIAQEESDGSTAPYSGYLGVVGWGKFDPTFERAIKRLEPGEIIKEPILTDFGYHIIRRESLRVKNYAANVFVITYRGATNIEGIPYRRKNRKQKKDAALEVINGYAEQLTPENFEEMCFQHSDFRRGGGFFGNFRRYDSITTLELSSVLDKLKYGELSDVLDLPFGYAVLQRVKVEKLAMARILVMHNEIENPPKWMTRPKAEAKAIAEGLLASLDGNAKQFAKVARKNSEGLYKGGGGIVPMWLAGEKDYDLESALKNLAIGEVHSEVLDLTDGYQIVMRIDPAQLEGNPD